MRRRFALVFLAAISLAVRAEAQEPADTAAAVVADTADSTDYHGGEPGPWLTSYFPYPGRMPNDGPALAFRVRHFRPATDHEGPLSYHAAYTLDAGATTRGGRFASVHAELPNLAPGWRLEATVHATREVRYGFYGLGNDSQFTDSLVTDAQPHLYQLRRNRYQGIIEATRRLRGPLQVALQADLHDAHFSALPGPSVFRTAFGADLEESDLAGRVALIYDTRDREDTPVRGVLLEAGAQLGSGSDSYGRFYSVMRGYLPLREGTTLTARVGGSKLTATPTLNSRFAIPVWESSLPVLGGPQSHRGLEDGRLIGKGVLFGSLAIKHNLIDLNELGAITLTGLLDAGRVFEDEKFRLTLSDMKVGAGGAIGIRIMRAVTFAFNFVGGSEGFNFSVSTNGGM